MGKVKIKKSDIWIDMTPMSDVMTLLLTFFMLTSTFIKNEPVRVNVPGTVSETKVPETNTLSITVSPEKVNGEATGNGLVFLGMSNAAQLGQMLDDMLPGTDALQKNVFESEAQFGVPLSSMKTYLSLDQAQRSEILQGNNPKVKAGIPLDSIDGGMSEFQQWVTAALVANTDVQLVIKSDKDTPYKTIKKVMSELQDMGESHYYMATQLDGGKVLSARSYIENMGGEK
ncbi:MAG: biopolymer transporter ExbD [Prevotella sp.]|nr:biopolymer transporter ExbD [Prevotella sp.]MBO4658681.1 biopolymer transporter ExbD [Prevotella sp.]